MNDAESAARLLEDAFVSMVEENEPFMPAVEQLYAALQEAGAAVTVLEARLSQDLRRGDLESGGRGISREPLRIVGGGHGSGGRT